MSKQESEYGMFSDKQNFTVMGDLKAAYEALKEKFEVEPLDTPTRYQIGDHVWFVDGEEVHACSQILDDRCDLNSVSYFRTEESAQAAAEAIEALLEYIHNADLSMPFAENEAHAWPLVKAAEAARAAVSEGTE